VKLKRYYIPDSIIFITQVTQDRQPVFADDACVVLLQETLRKVQSLHPFSMLGYVFLPDHFHVLIRPRDQSNFSTIMHSLKPNFTKAFKQHKGLTGSVKLWQMRFYDHVIRNEVDLQRHLDYIHYNPVKHGYADKAEDWPYSSFVSWAARGAYPDRWGWSEPASIRGVSNMGGGVIPSRYKRELHGETGLTVTLTVAQGL